MRVTANLLTRSRFVRGLYSGETSLCWPRSKKNGKAPIQFEESDKKNLAWLMTSRLGQREAYRNKKASGILWCINKTKRLMWQLERKRLLYTE